MGAEGKIDLLPSWEEVCHQRPLDREYCGHICLWPYLKEWEYLENCASQQLLCKLMRDQILPHSG